MLPERHVGTVEKLPLPATAKSPSKKQEKEADPGIIMYDVNGTKQTIPFGAAAIVGVAPKNSEKVCNILRNP